MTQKAKFSVVLYPQETGGFTAICPELQGCITQGETYEEALENIKDAIIALFAKKEDREDFLHSLAVPNKIFTEVEIDANA